MSCGRLVVPGGEDLCTVLYIVAAGIDFGSLGNEDERSLTCNQTWVEGGVIVKFNSLVTQWKATWNLVAKYPSGKGRPNIDGHRKKLEVVWRQLTSSSFSIKLAWFFWNHHFVTQNVHQQVFNCIARLRDFTRKIIQEKKYRLEQQYWLILVKSHFCKLKIFTMMLPVRGGDSFHSCFCCMNSSLGRNSFFSWWLSER